MTLRERIADYLVRNRIQGAALDKCAGDTREEYMALADGVLALLVDKEPPNDEALQDVYGEAMHAGGGYYQYSWGRRSLYDFGYARGVASQEQELAEARKKISDLEYAVQTLKDWYL